MINEMLKILKKDGSVTIEFKGKLYTLVDYRCKYGTALQFETAEGRHLTLDQKDEGCIRLQLSLLD